MVDLFSIQYLAKVVDIGTYDASPMRSVITIR